MCSNGTVTTLEHTFPTTSNRTTLNLCPKAAHCHKCFQAKPLDPAIVRSVIPVGKANCQPGKGLGCCTAQLAPAHALHV